MQTLKPLPNELYEFYPSMSAQTHEAHVKAYAKSHMKEENTSPAPPVEGLETVHMLYDYHGVGEWKHYPPLDPHRYPDLKNRNLCDQSQAEDIIAAKEQERNDSCKAWRDAFDSMHRRAMDAEANNAALTARVKELEQVAAYETDVAQAEIDGRKALETQLAAARKALADIDNLDQADGHELKLDDAFNAVRIARAALEAKP